MHSTNVRTAACCSLRAGAADAHVRVGPTGSCNACIAVQMLAPRSQLRAASPPDSLLIGPCSAGCACLRTCGATHTLAPRALVRSHNFGQHMPWDSSIRLRAPHREAQAGTDSCSGQASRQRARCLRRGCMRMRYFWYRAPGKHDQARHPPLAQAANRAGRPQAGAACGRSCSCSTYIGQAPLN